MPITIHCPRCGMRYAVQEHLAGQQAWCSCGAALMAPPPTVGGFAVATSPPPVAPLPVAPPRVAPPPAAPPPAAPPRVATPLAAPPPVAHARVATGWRVRTGDGQVHGPVSKDLLEKAIAARRLDAETYVSPEGCDQWRPLVEFYPVLATQKTGYELAPAAQSQSSQGGAWAVNPCPHCKSDKPPGASFCVACGFHNYNPEAALGDGHGKKFAQDEKDAATNRKVALVLGGVFYGLR